MSKSLQKPTILNVETVARSRLFTVESVDLEFSNGVRRVYERMRPTNREAVMIVPIVDDHLILIREYAVGTESYELGFSKGLIDPGESVFEAANRELKEEVGFGANDLTFEEAQHGTVLLFQQNEYRGSARSLPGITGRR